MLDRKLLLFVALSVLLAPGVLLNIPPVGGGLDGLRGSLTYGQLNLAHVARLAVHAVVLAVVLKQVGVCSVVKM